MKKFGHMFCINYKTLQICNPVVHFVPFFTYENLFFSGKKTLDQHLDVNSKNKFLRDFASFFLLFLPFYSFYMQKRLKSILWLVFGVRSNQLLVQIYYRHKEILDLRGKIITVTMFLGIPCWGLAIVNLNPVCETPRPYIFIVSDITFGDSG